jgi:hypothetical protein
MRVQSGHQNQPLLRERKAISVETQDHNGGDRPVLYRSQQSVHTATESAVQGRKS